MTVWLLTHPLHLLPASTDDDSSITCRNYLGSFKSPNAQISLLEMIWSVWVQPGIWEMLKLPRELCAAKVETF